MKLSELAAGTSSTIERGDPDAEITGAAGLDIAKSGDITFLANPKYTPQIKETHASAIFLNEGVQSDRDDLAVLRASDAYLAYTRALRLFHPDSKVVPSVHPTAIIDPSANVDAGCEIGPHVVIGKNCKIASGVKIFANVTIRRCFGRPRFDPAFGSFRPRKL